MKTKTNQKRLTKIKTPPKPIPSAPQNLAPSPVPPASTSSPLNASNTTSESALRITKNKDYHTYSSSNTFWKWSIKESKVQEFYGNWIGRLMQIRDLCRICLIIWWGYRIGIVGVIIIIMKIRRIIVTIIEVGGWILRTLWRQGWWVWGVVIVEQLEGRDINKFLIKSH